MPEAKSPWEEVCDDLKAKTDRLQAAAKTIWKIVHTPSGSRRPLDHFPADFDQIRATLKPIIRPLEK